MDEPGGCSRRIANVGLAVALLGAVLIWVVPGGLVSDIPGWTLLIFGALTELAFTGAYLVRRTSRR